MMKEACVDPSPYDIVLVHSQSRFFRNATGFHAQKAKLDKHHVSLASITQDFDDSPQGQMMSGIIAEFDAYQSAETAKHVTRSMLENAKQGFWNGSKPPMGYRTKVAEIRGSKEKKVLEPDPKNAQIIQLIFNLYEKGLGGDGPMGTKKITEHLNTRGFTTDKGKPFYVGFIGKILRRESYVGRHYFNRYEKDSKVEKPRDEWIEVPVPALISEAQFNSVQAKLDQRNPRKTPPRQTSSPVLLTGMARCSSCGSNMKLRTGKGEGGLYRYYTCANAADKGMCDSPQSVPMPKLDMLVTDAIADHLFTPDRLQPLLREVIKKAREAKTGALAEIKQLEKEERVNQKKIDNLLDAVAEGTVTDGQSIKRKLTALESKRTEFLRLLGEARRKTQMPPQALSNAQIERFGTALRKLLADGPIGFRKAYLDLIVDEITVSREQVTITGSKAALAAAAIHGQSASPEEVRSFERKWRTGEDSNSRPLDS